MKISLTIDQLSSAFRKYIFWFHGYAMAFGCFQLSVWAVKLTPKKIWQIMTKLLEFYLYAVTIFYIDYTDILVRYNCYGNHNVKFKIHRTVLINEKSWPLQTEVWTDDPTLL